MFLGFVYAARSDQIGRELASAFPTAWAETLRPAATYLDRRVRGGMPELDVQRLQELIRNQRSTFRGSVLFAIDQRPESVRQLTDDLIYKIPSLEIVPVKSGHGFLVTMREHLEYYGLIASPRPANVAEALEMFGRRHPSVIVLKRAARSAEDSITFEQPRAALWSLHYLARVYVDWADAKRRDPQRSNHNDFRLVRQPHRNLMREIIQDSNFDLSPSDRAVEWACPDGHVRDFGWHLKWSLASPREARYHLRVHYAHEQVDENPTLLYLGHCGPHLS